MVSMPYGHIHVSEQQAGADLDCLWMSAIEWLRECRRPSIPATHAEGDRLRAASGDTGTSNMTNLRIGVARRYASIDLPPSQVGFAQLWEKLTPGRMALVSGKLTNMTKHYRRWYPNYTKGHSCTVTRTGPGPDDLWWCDPGAPPGYDGEPITKDQLRAFIGNYGYPNLVGTRVILPPPPPPATMEDDMPALTSYIPGYTAVIKKDASVRAEPKLTGEKLRGTSTKESWTVTGWVDGETFSGSTQWLTRFHQGKWEYTVKANVIEGPTAPILGVPEAVCAARVETASNAGYNSGLDVAQAAVTNLPRK